MSSLKREMNNLACVHLPGEKKKQPFKTKVLEYRTRGDLRHRTMTIDGAHDESQPTQDSSMAETSSNNSRPKNDPLDNDEAFIKFFSVLKAPCFLSPPLRRRRSTRSLHS
jgi:hypothetical protein